MAAKGTTKTAENDTTDEVTDEVSDLFADMEIEEEVTASRGGGRQHTAEVLRIREELEKMVEQGDEAAARSFKNVNSDNREEFARKIRSAGKISPEIKVATRLDSDKGKLFWGPADVIDRRSVKR